MFDTDIDDWDGLRMFVVRGGDRDGDVEGLAIRDVALHGVPLATVEGIAVADMRSDLSAIGPEDVHDSEGDGVADQVGFGFRDIRGTKSLAEPGATGSEFALAPLDGDVITELHLPGNDFCDL
ncbi:hypothetical protein OVN20_06635 [Microcella daejeonensis]|uniref:hypothetical protein n=1 Tax=Microcella daejeonensis TaxID=2994971 RepID=UPI00226FEB33|nr:hypothetical protein [Microcella daejeonensis]WAB85216.1 hypothetical protein OVN20_06635 [Microcella daejeonensis]